MKLTYALLLPHNIITIDIIETSKYSLLAAMHGEALLSLAIACKISNQKTNKYEYIRLIRTGLHIKNDKMC